MSAEMKERAREIIERLAKLDQSKRPAGGAHGQVIGMEPYVIRTTGDGLQCLYDAQSLLDELLDPFNRRPAPQGALTGALPELPDLPTPVQEVAAWVTRDYGRKTSNEMLDPYDVYFSEDHMHAYARQYAQQCIEARNQQGDAGWISVDEQMPPSGQRVIFGWVNSLGKWRTSMGNWNARFTQEAQNSDEEACEYNEADDTYYLLEGWNEWGWELEFSEYVSDPVTHWQPIPPPPAIEQRKADKKGDV